MDEVTVSFSVYFEGPFWIGIVERVWKEHLAVCKITFGSEPGEYEIFGFLLTQYYRLQFSPAVTAEKTGRIKNPKRRQREARRMLENVCIGTKAQEALKLQHSQIQTERKSQTRKEREEEKQLAFERKQQKKKEKHRGR